MPDKGKFTIDRVLKDLFQTDRPSLLDRWSQGAQVMEFLNVEFQHMIQRRADLVARLNNGRLLHVEFQAQNDNEICYRLGIYCLLIGQQNRQPVEQVVLYVGKAKMTMKSHLEAGSTKVSIRLIDIREFDAEVFLRSGRPGDLALAALARDGIERLIEIGQAVAKLEGPERDRVMLQLLLLLGLRKVPGEVKMELTKMTNGFPDISENEILRDFLANVGALHLAKAEAAGLAKGEAVGMAKGEAVGMAKMLRQQLRTKFGRLPHWADERLDTATAHQIARWSKKFVTAQSLEGVLGKQ